MGVRYLLGFLVFVMALGVAVAQDVIEGLPVTHIKVGRSYQLDGGGLNTWGRIIQIIDDNNMLVGIDNGATNPGGRPRYSVTVWCKFSTEGLTDGKDGFLANILSVEQVTATKTIRYKTALGGTRTVFVLEPYGKAKK